MSRGITANHNHPVREHTDGWGAIWRAPMAESGLEFWRSVEPMAKRLAGTPLAELKTDFLAVHIRKSTFPENVDLDHTHPIRHPASSVPWFMMHNGYMPNAYRELGMVESTFDTAEYLHYLVPNNTAMLDAYEVREKLDRLEGTLCANAVIVNPKRCYVVQWFPENTKYASFYTMYRLRTQTATFVSSEVISDIGPVSDWEPLERFTFLSFALVTDPTGDE